MIHQITSHLVKNHDMIAIERLAVQSMTASARGTLEEPGRNVAQKAGLNRAILDKGWGELRRQLIYKLAWKGGGIDRGAGCLFLPGMRRLSSCRQEQPQEAGLSLHLLWAL